MHKFVIKSTVAVSQSSLGYRGEFKISQVSQGFLGHLAPNFSAGHCLRGPAKVLVDCANVLKGPVVQQQHALLRDTEDRLSSVPSEGMVRNFGSLQDTAGNRHSLTIVLVETVRLQSSVISWVS